MLGILPCFFIVSAENHVEMKSQLILFKSNQIYIYIYPLDQHLMMLNATVYNNLRIMYI